MNKTIVTASSIAVLVSTLGIAAAQAQTKDISLKPDMRGYAVDQRDVAVRSGTGLCWRTGSWTPAMAIAECDPDLVKKPAPPAPVAPPVRAIEAPKPAPAPAPVAAKPCDFAASLSSDETFGFNKSDLAASAKAKLDKDVLGKLGNCSKVNLIMITGHSDRLGSAQYNQKLSEKRAEAVKNYLASKNADASVMDTMGAGKTQPAQGVAKCADDLPRKKLIECLAPNRRVVVEVKGTAR